MEDMFFFVFKKLPMEWKMNAYWWAMRNHHHRLAYKITPYLLTDDYYYLYKLAHRACFHGDLK